MIPAEEDYLRELAELNERHGVTLTGGSEHTGPYVGWEGPGFMNDMQSPISPNELLERADTPAKDF